LHRVIYHAHARSSHAQNVVDSAHYIEIAVNFRACARSELLKWIG